MRVKENNGTYIAVCQKTWLKAVYQHWDPAEAKKKVTKMNNQIWSPQDTKKQCSLSYGYLMLVWYIMCIQLSHKLLYPDQDG